MTMFLCRFSVMIKCWEGSPKDRPSFSNIYKEVSKLIERVAGYLDIEFNPFTGGEKQKCVIENKNGE